MITGTLENISDYEAIYPSISELTDYMKDNSLADLSIKTTLKTITLIPLNSAAVADSFDPRVLEAHRKQMDIHITLSGIDEIAYADLEKESSVFKEFDEANDYLLAYSDAIKTISVPENYFCIIPNQFAHMALYAGHKDAKKIVVKLYV
jgi:YhcH/YjgK/YiaL family protein